jgi:ATP-binding cassette, subfamily G (WHITE), member 2, PDR
MAIPAGILWGFFMFFFATYLLASQYVSLSKSRGEVLVFRKGHIQRKEKLEDKEAGSPGAMSMDEPIKMDSLRQISTFSWEDVVYDIKVSRSFKFVLSFHDE